ncbi:sugar kinase [Nonomuraea sp. NPDC003804]|uniref:sugar kinase n=1 Tax=Nonomuraea sp. NPDC003804 TaxID=3154547 RepID=UPI0033B4FBE6
MSDVYTMGEPLGVVSSGRIRHDGEARIDVGGPELTLAIALARLGHRVSFLGKVGADELGARITTVLRGEGVDVSDMREDGTAPTGLLLKESRVGHDPRVTHYRVRSAGSRLSPGNVPIDRIAASRLLHITGVTPALGLDPRDAVETAVGAALTAGVPVSMSVDYHAALWPSLTEAEEVLGALARRSSLLFVRQDELDLVKPALTPDREVVVTRGPKGASVRSGGVRYDAPALPVPVVDTMGAGAAFAAGYLSAVLDGLTPQERLGRGAALGAAAVTSASDWQGLPTRAELDGGIRTS